MISAVTLAACAASQAVLARRAHLAREELVGLSRDNLLSCAGTPNRAQQTGNWEYLSYLGKEPLPESKHTRCVVTFMLRSGYVEAVDYETPSGGLIGKSIPECLDVVDRCLPAME